MMGVVEHTTPVTHGFLEQVARDTNRILRQVNLPEIAVATSRGEEFSFAEEEPGPPPSRATGPEPIHAVQHREFLEQAKGILYGVQECVSALSVDATDLSAARKLERMLASSTSSRRRTTSRNTRAPPPTARR